VVFSMKIAGDILARGDIAERYVPRAKRYSEVPMPQLSTSRIKNHDQVCKYSEASPVGANMELWT